MQDASDQAKMAATSSIRSSEEPNATAIVESPTPSNGSSAGGSLMKAAGLMAALLLGSKLLGFFRDWAILTVYGASTATDAYFAAVQLPQASIVLLGGLGGPFHTVTITVLSRLLEKKNGGATSEQLTEKARLLAATFTTATGLFFALLAVLCYLFAEPIMSILLGGASLAAQSGNDAASHAALLGNATRQLQIMAPVVWIGGLVGILYGGLNLLQVYVWPALSPTVLSIAMLVALWLFPADEAGHLLAWSTLVGAILQLAIQIPQYLSRGFQLRPTLQSLKTPEMRQLGELLFPAMIGTTIGQLTTFVDMAFASALPAGGWSAVTLSNRLMQLPIGVMQTALLVPLFPRLSKLAADKQPEELSRQARLGISSLWLIALPLVVIMAFLIEPMIALVFEHGNFTAKDTALVSWAIFWQLGSMLPYFLRDTLTRVFYAYQDTRTPLLVGLSAIGLKALLNWLLMVGWLHLGVGGITFSITLVTLWNALLLGWLSRRYVPHFGYKQLLVSLGKMIIAVLPVVAWLAFVRVQGLYVVWHTALAGVMGTLMAQGLILFALSMSAIALYGAALMGMRLPEAQLIWERLGSRFKTSAK